MAVGAGMEVGQREADMMATTAAQMSEALINLLRAVAGRRGTAYADEIDRGAKVITEHVKHGGEINQSIIQEKDAAVFERALRICSVPYMQIRITTEGGVKKRMYFTRGGGNAPGLSNDNERLQKAWDMYTMQMRVGLNEISPQEFVSLSDGQPITRYDGVSIEEAELFRLRMAGKQATYSIMHDISTGAKRPEDVLEETRRLIDEVFAKTSG